ncbi:hypothetical protein EJ04DRAFT_444171 [Polyplosphaeria fusca]|uniref:Uncharacterized protein n=1 Tax=Polyplosphaeria fusca TaxID=682080 RepID=A0A9P4QTV5_9PLEO|nr:hypothetical protein EJ04DRAFT_444171 [Polyplosphaeria fusca]
MQSERPNLSITLPRNFMFHYKDGQPPRTPEPEQHPDQFHPPAPPRQVLKVRRRRTVFAADPPTDGLGSDLPIPTIEAPELHSDESMGFPAMAPALNNDYLSPGVFFNRIMSPPKTPEAQMRSLADVAAPQHWADMDIASQSESSSRPTSSSGFSDSSMSSRGSFESFPSFGGSCTSPEEDMADPFSMCSPTARYAVSESPFAAPPHQPPMKLKMRATFTEAMDNHIWLTYMKYLQDPTVTPFKALPSTVPPNGVCHRVARMARKTWKGSRSSSCLAVSRASQHSSRCGTPDTIKPAKSGSSTPISGMNKPYARFPSEKQVRKRLRELSKQRPTLSAHYQRLLHRSPSPFQSSPQETSQPHGLSSPFDAGAPSFSTRDMNVSLTTSTAESMQFGNPLSQLTANATPRIADDWTSARTSAHQKSQSLHIGLGLGLGNILGSSFSAMNQMTGESLSQHNAQTWHAPANRPPRLGSPLQLHAPRPISRVFKRRALHNFEDQARNRGNSFVNELFGAPAESSHRRVRSRGFSLGDMVEGARRLAASPPAASPEEPQFGNLSELLHNVNASPPTHLDAQEQATIRLGSPFAGRSSNTFPRASTSHGFEPPASFEQRFAGLPSDPDHLHL